MSRIKAFLTQRLTTKITIPIAVMLLLGIATVGAVFTMVNAQKTDANVINEAERLRMLSQKIAKATFMFAHGHDAARDELLATAALFDKGFNGVRYGDAEMDLPPASARLEAQLEQMAGLWEPFHTNVKLLAEAVRGTTIFDHATEAIGASNVELLAEASEAVKLFEAEAARKITNLFTVLFVILGLDVLAFVVACMLIRRATRPVTQLAETADRVASGDLTATVDVQTHDEVGQLAGSFGHMLAKIRRSVNDTETLVELMVRTSEEQDIDTAIEAFLQDAKTLTNARYAALSTFDAAGNVDKFTTIGVPEQMKRQIGRLPEGNGLLGHIHHTKQVLRLDDMAHHPQAAGFPAGHVPMKALLAAPILYSDKSMGNLYLADKEDGADAFDEDDERIIVLAAKVMGILLNEKYANQGSLRAEYLEAQTNELVDVMDRLAQGDFTVGIDTTDHGDAISRLKIKTQDTVASLRELIGQVRQAVTATVSAAAQISSATEELAAGAQEQSTQASEVAAAVEEMARTIVENAQNATETASVAQQNGQLAQNGGHIVKETVEKIREIAEVVGQSAQTVERLGASSQQIDEIIKVIDEIADQTNLLALNAAIEAARAGEQGRGFAVVADEVRKLAERTTQATQQIAGMIRTIQVETEQAVHAMQRGTEEVETGIGLADETGTAFQRIVGQTQQTEDLISQIASASEEQSTTSEQISRSVEAISTVAQESARGLGEIAHSTDDLNRLMEQLQKLVARFKVDQADVNVAIDRPPAARQQPLSQRKDTGPAAAAHP